MKLQSSHRLGGFTLIELIVVIAILVTLVAISAPTLYRYLGAGDEAKCRSNVEQISQLGLKYSQDMAHRALLPTSGMDDDEDTKYVDESEGWWLSVAPELDSTVFPTRAKGKMKVSSIFHCPADTRARVDTDSLMPASVKTVSYVSWTDATEDPKNPNSCIRTTARQNLDILPWISDGIPIKGQSVRDLASFRKMVMPALSRHGGTLIVAYASGLVSSVKVEDEEAKPDVVFRRIAPSLAERKDKKDSRRQGDDSSREDEEELEEEE